MNIKRSLSEAAAAGLSCLAAAIIGGCGINTQEEICGSAAGSPAARQMVMAEIETPAELNVPPEFVAVFDCLSSGVTTVFGDMELMERRFTPCSTFKIVSTLMGLDAKAIAGLDSKLGYNGATYEYAAWNKDVTLLEAFRSSCLPYYKKLVGKLSKPYVQNALNRLNYGNCDLYAWNSNGHNVFWVESTLQISPVEQILVLEKIFGGDSGFAPEHVANLKTCMAAGQGRAGEFAVFGKTGAGRNHNTNCLEAWFVGFAESADGEKIFFAAHGASPERDITSPEVRKIILNLLENNIFKRNGAKSLQYGSSDCL